MSTSLISHITFTDSADFSLFLREVRSSGWHLPDAMRHWASYANDDWDWHFIPSEEEIWSRVDHSLANRHSVAVALQRDQLTPDGDTAFFFTFNPTTVQVHWYPEPRTIAIPKTNIHSADFYHNQVQHALAALSDKIQWLTWTQS